MSREVFDAARAYYWAQRPREAVSEGRAWLFDCYEDEDSQVSIALLNAVTVVLAVERAYEGGWLAFLQASDNLNVAKVAA